jgi:hypothetical protein
MAPDSDDMSDLDRPVTRRELRAELQEFRAEVRGELQEFRTELRGELLDFRTELRGEFRAAFATKADLLAATEELRTEMSTGFAEMRGYVDFSVKSSRDDLRTHFDVVAESLRGDIHNVIDWLKANLNGMMSRVDALETGHGARLTTTRVTKLEADRN